MRRSIKTVNEGDYKLLKNGDESNNCQDYADKLRKRYGLFMRGDKQR